MSRSLEEAWRAIEVLRHRVSSVTASGILGDHVHAGTPGDGGTFDAANLTAGASGDGTVLTSDGAGGAAWEAIPTLANHDHSGDAGDGGTFDAANLTAGASGDGTVLTSDGAGGAAWEALPAIANHDHSGDAGDGGTFDAANLTAGASTDGQVLMSDGAGGAAWESEYSTINYIIDGGGSAITTGAKDCLITDFACTLVSWTILADVSGTIKIDVWKDTYANYPPTDADSITNGHEPQISVSAAKAQDTDISDWSDVTVDAGDVLKFNVDSCATITRCTLSFKVKRT